MSSLSNQRWIKRDERVDKAKTAAKQRADNSYGRYPMAHVCGCVHTRGALHQVYSGTLWEVQGEGGGGPVNGRPWVHRDPAVRPRRRRH